LTDRVRVEVAFPSPSPDDFDFVRSIIDQRIPDGVASVLTQCHLAQSSTR
jgi:isopropylmalate/homocitrate/citramalate synthase